MIIVIVPPHLGIKQTGPDEYEIVPFEDSDVYCMEGEILLTRCWEDA